MMRRADVERWTSFGDATLGVRGESVAVAHIKARLPAGIEHTYLCLREKGGLELNYWVQVPRNSRV